MDHAGEPEPRVVQIAGGEPAMMADAARRNVDLGAQIIDINMGCPAKKVCNRAAGSALLRDESLVADILGAVVRAVEVPVTLKMRTGWDAAQRNGLRIARIAEDLGMQALAVHGRTRADHYQGAAEYDNDSRDQSGGADSGFCEWRHRLRRESARGTRRNRRRCRDDRARRAGTAVDLPRNTAFPYDREGLPAAGARRSP